jgi:hypothetical protein
LDNRKSIISSILLIYLSPVFLKSPPKILFSVSIFFN